MPNHPAPHEIVRKERASDAEVIGDVELFAREMRVDGKNRAPVIAITGTNGKSTTTALLAQLRSEIPARLLDTFSAILEDDDRLAALLAHGRHIALDLIEESEA